MNTTLKKIDLKNLNLKGMILEAREAFEEVIEDTPEIMRRSNIESDSVFVGEDFCYDIEELFEEIENGEEVILFLPFMIDPSMYGGEDILYLANKEQYELENSNYNYGDLQGTENGYLIIINGNEVIIHRGDNRELNSFQVGVKLVKSFGEFDKKLVEYLDKFIKK